VLTISYIEAIIFGIIQGITEFLPVSSTAHLVITELILGYDFPGLGFEIYLHLASALAVIIYFRKDLYDIMNGFFNYYNHKTTENKISFYFGLYIIIATIITGGLGVFLKNAVSEFMKTPQFMALTLSLTALFLIFIERIHEYGTRTEKEMKFSDSIIVGLGQTLAVLPGVSRSGSTLIAALWSGLSRKTAVRYSFILVIPVILGSTVLAIEDFLGGMWLEIGTGPLIISFFSSFIFSIIGIIWLIDILRKSRLFYLAIYCFILALLIFHYREMLTI